MVQVFYRCTSRNLITYVIKKLLTIHIQICFSIQPKQDLCIHIQLRLILKTFQKFENTNHYNKTICPFANHSPSIQINVHQECFVSNHGDRLQGEWSQKSKDTKHPLKIDFLPLGGGFERTCYHVLAMNDTHKTKHISYNDHSQAGGMTSLKNLICSLQRRLKSMELKKTCVFMNSLVELALNFYMFLWNDKDFLHNFFITESLAECLQNKAVKLDSIFL